MVSMEDGTGTPRTDIVVVGGGFSGICAAIAATENGASVTVLDRAYGGGASAISGGVIYAGGGTKQQKEAGYGDDTPENMYRYLQHEVGDAVDEPTLRMFCEESVSLLEWLESHGAKFGSSLCPFKTSYPASDYSLYFSGNEKAHPFATLAKPAPRGHRPLGKGSGMLKMTGGDLWQAVFESALRLGVRFESASRVQEIVMDSDGHVKGVRYLTIDDTAKWVSKSHKWFTQNALKFQTTIEPLVKLLDFLADCVWKQGAREKTLESGAVILAAGGFIMNKDMTQKSIPSVKRMAPIGTAGDDGSGIQLGQRVGGSVSHMDRISAWRFVYPPEALLDGIIVSAEGERIAAEDQYGGTFADAMINRSNGQGFLILDSLQWEKAKSQLDNQAKLLWKTVIQYLLFWAHRRANTLEDLARKLGVNPVNMKATVEAYNVAIVSESPDPVRKLNNRSVIATGPFYGIDVSLRQSGIFMVPVLTLGGLRVDSQSGMVLDDAGSKIRGVYAAGRNAVGICSNSYVSGLSLADCVFSGKRAGTHAAQSRETLI